MHTASDIQTGINTSTWLQGVGYDLELHDRKREKHVRELDRWLNFVTPQMTYCGSLFLDLNMEIQLQKRYPFMSYLNANSNSLNVPTLCNRRPNVAVQKSLFIAQ
jgi:hypothetical protein